MGLIQILKVPVVVLVVLQANMLQIREALTVCNVQREANLMIQPVIVRFAIMALITRLLEALILILVFYVQMALGQEWVLLCALHVKLDISVITLQTASHVL